MTAETKILRSQISLILEAKCAPAKAPTNIAIPRTIPSGMSTNPWYRNTTVATSDEKTLITFVAAIDSAYVIAKNPMNDAVSTVT